MDDQRPRLEETHSYDGIVEEQNALPRWWLYLFYLTALFAPCYVLYFHGLGGKNIQTTFQEESAANQQANAQQTLPNESPEALESLAQNPAALEKGRASFLAKCAPCHGQQGQGQIGPNLTDDFWIHGDGKMAGMLEVAREGIPTKGMPAWKTLMSDEELKATVAFARSLRGTHPPGGKAAEGSEHKEP